MKTCVIGNRNNVDIVETEIPHISEGDMLIEMRACGICGTDIEKVRGNYSSRILGHEAVGVVAKTGARVKNFQVGDRVFPHHHVPCYQCHYCRRGSETMCPHFSRSNLDPGGLSEYFRMPEWNVERNAVFRIPDSMNFRIAALIEPFACVVRSLGKTVLNEGDTAAVVGVGPVGLMHVVALKLYGRCRIAAVDVSKRRLDFAGEIGAGFTFGPAESVEGVLSITDGIGADTVFVATGNRDAIAAALAMVRKGGRVIQFGLPPPGLALPADYSEIFKREISIISTYSAVEKDVEKAIRIIAGDAAHFEKLISHTFRLENAREAFELAEKADDARKIVIER